MTENATLAPLDLATLRRDFPILESSVHGKPLVYLDNAATTLKPEPVLAAMARYYRSGAANIHRGVHYLSEMATRDFEAARVKVQRFIGAKEPREIIFTSGTTAAINIVAHSFGERLNPGDEIVISAMEHHANIVPWQMLAKRRGTVLKVAPITDEGELDLEGFERCLSPRTRLVSIVAVSNALGTVNPVHEVIQRARVRGIPVLLDAAQAVAHLPLNVAELGCDFLAFSGHKLYGPTGIGVLYGRYDLLDTLPPVFGGGDMIRTVTFAESTYAELPARLEAGTPAIAEVIGLGAAIDYVTRHGIATLAQHEDQLLAYGTERLKAVPGLKLIGTAPRKASILGFTLGDIHPHDIGSLLDLEGVAIRAGHHCAQPVMARFGVPATARASLAFYNRREDIDVLVEGLHKIVRMFA